MRRTLAVVLISLWALIGLPGAAQAKGGPTSVLITQPGEQQATALYVASPDYAELERLLINNPTLSERIPPRGLGSFDYYQITWMDHDQQSWRRDTVFITRSGTEYLLSAGPDSWFGSEVASTKEREVAKSGELETHLERLFAETASTSTAAQSVVAQQPAAAPPAVPAEPVTRWFSLAGWRWAAPGVLGGLLVGLVVSRRRSPAEPRRVLVDASPSGTSAAGA